MGPLCSAPVCVLHRQYSRPLDRHDAMTDNEATSTSTGAAATGTGTGTEATDNRAAADAADAADGTASRKRPLDDVVKDTADPDNNTTPPDAKQAKIAYKPKPSRKKKTDPDLLELRRLVQLCCSRDDLDTAIRAYDVAVGKGIHVEAQTFYNLLNLCDGLSDRGIHIGTPRGTDKDKDDGNDDSNDSDKADAAKTPSKPIVQVSPKERREHAFRIKKQMESISLPLNEPAYTALIRILSKANDTEGAGVLLTEAEKCQQCKPKLRLYSPLVLTYCDNGDMMNAVRIWGRMCKIGTEGVVDRGSANSEDIIQPSEREYCALVQCATKTRCSVVMERVLSGIAEDVLVPSADTTNAIVSWFESPGSALADTMDGNGKGGDIVQTDEEIESVLPPRGEDLPTMGPVVCTVPATWEISRNCRLDTSTAIFTTGCLTGKQLKPVELSPKAWSDMMKMNEAIVLEGSVEGHTSQFQGGRKGQKRTSKMKNAIEKRKRNWESFKQYLADRVGPSCIDEPSDVVGRKPFDVVIDGANIGYYKQNFANSPKHVDYKQIDWAISHFTEQGRSVLMVLHERHFNRNLMPEWAAPIAKSWEDKGVLYKAPAGSNDDWFWLHSALWCGRNTLVLTNDEMRDHHFQMLAHRVFLRWKERSQMHFTFGGEWYDHAKGDKRRPLLLTNPDIYSRRIQRLDDKSLVIPLAKRGDSNRFLDGSHDADDSAPVEEMYVCINTKTSS